MKRQEALRSVYETLDGCAVVTIMGAVAAELQSVGHRPNFFYLQHAMGLASSMGLGIAYSLAMIVDRLVFAGPRRRRRQEPATPPEPS